MTMSSSRAHAPALAILALILPLAAAQPPASLIENGSFEAAFAYESWTTSPHAVPAMVDGAAGSATGMRVTEAGWLSQRVAGVQSAGVVLDFYARINYDATSQQEIYVLDSVGHVIVDIELGYRALNFYVYDDALHSAMVWLADGQWHHYTAIVGGVGPAGVASGVLLVDGEVALTSTGQLETSSPTALAGSAGRLHAVGTPSLVLFGAGTAAPHMKYGSVDYDEIYVGPSP